MSRETSDVVRAVARKHPEIDERLIAKILISAANELHGELVVRSLRWRSSGDPGAHYREIEARVCASLVFALGEVH